MMERVKNYFKNYPESKECFETSDGLLFHVRHRATAHAQTLEDKGVKTHRRESQAEEPKLKLSKKDQEAAAKAEAEKLAKEEAEKAEAEKLAKEEAEKAEAEKLAKEEAEKAAAEAEKKSGKTK
jgi:hypothetical protein